jgi:nuclear pore complex protein Nup107
MKHAKHLISTLEALFEHIFDPTFNPMKDANMWKVYKAYVPELIIAYLSVLQSGAFYIHRDNVTKAMDIATIVADEEKVWLQQVFMQTGRMKELVSTLARVSKAMLKLGEFGDGKKTKGKRGSKGETLRIWDPNA